MANDDQIGHENWYVHPNDLIGGWSVLTVDRPPSTLTHRGDGREVATLAHEADARRIAELHNAESGGPSATDQQTRTVAEEAAKNWALRYPIPAWGLAEGERADRLAETWARVVAGMVLDALRAAGRLLPEGGETRTEWGVAGTADFRGDPYVCRSQQETERSADYQRRHGYPAAYVVARTAREWSDGTALAGPWVAVDQETTDAQ